MVYTRPVWVRIPVNWLNRLIQSGFKNNGANSKQDKVLISELLSSYFQFFNVVLVFILVLHYFTETFLCSKMSSEKFCITDLVTLVCAIISGHPVKKRSKPYIYSYIKSKSLVVSFTNKRTYKCFLVCDSYSLGFAAEHTEYQLSSKLQNHTSKGVNSFRIN